MRACTLVFEALTKDHIVVIAKFISLDEVENMFENNRELIEEYIEQHESSDNTKMLDFLIRIVELDN